MLSCLKLIEPYKGFGHDHVASVGLVCNVSARWSPRAFAGVVQRTRGVSSGQLSLQGVPAPTASIAFCVNICMSIMCV